MLFDFRSHANRLALTLNYLINRNIRDENILCLSSRVVYFSYLAGDLILSGAWRIHLVTLIAPLRSHRVLRLSLSGEIALIVTAWGHSRIIRVLPFLIL